MIREGFLEISDGWTLIHDLNSLSERIDKLAEWTKDNQPLTQDEQSTIEVMIDTQISWGLDEYGI